MLIQKVSVMFLDYWFLHLKEKHFWKKLYFFFYFFLDFFAKSIFFVCKLSLFHGEIFCETNLEMVLCVGIVHAVSSKNIYQTFWELFFMNYQRAPQSFSLISVKTSNSYAIHAVWCVMHDVWCARLFFCNFLTLWVKGGPIIPHLVSFRPFECYSKIYPGGSHMYTLSYKVSYITEPKVD